MSLTGRTRTSDLGMTTEFTVPALPTELRWVICPLALFKSKKQNGSNKTTVTGLEPATAGSEVQRAIHCATRSVAVLTKELGQMWKTRKEEKEQKAQERERAKESKQKCMELMSAQRYFSTRKKMALQKNKVWTWSVLLLVSMKRSIERKTTGRQTAVNLKFFFPSSKARRRRKKLKASEWEKNSNRIGLNESQCKNCSWQVQLPRALMPKRQTNELCAHGYKFQSCEFAHKS